MLENLYWKRCWTSFAVVFKSILGFLNAKCNLVIFLNKYFVIIWLKFEWVVLIQIRIQSFSALSYCKRVFRITGSWHQVLWHEIDSWLNEFTFISAHKPREALYMHINAQAGLGWLHTHIYLIPQFWSNTWRWHSRSWDCPKCPRCPQLNHVLPSKKGSTLFRPTQPQCCCSCQWLSCQVSEVEWFFSLYLPSALRWTSRPSLCLMCGHQDPPPHALMKSPFTDLYVLTYILCLQ